MSGASEMSIDMWKSDSAAGEISASGAGVQTVVSWRTAAAARVARWRRWGFRLSNEMRRRIDMGGKVWLTCAWGKEGDGERARAMFGFRERVYVSQCLLAQTRECRR